MTCCVSFFTFKGWLMIDILKLRADFKATQCKPSLEYPVEILKHAVSVYTPAVFKLFNCELWLTWDCELHKDGEVGFVVKYISPRKSRQHIV